VKKLLLALTAATIAFGADLSGKWSGTFVELGPDGNVQRNGTAYMNLKVDGSTVTGTAGPSETEQSEISSGRIEGNKFTFDLKRPQFTLTFQMTLDGGALKGSATAERDGQKLTAKLDLKRQE
jgi:hypothetical protein